MRRLFVLVLLMAGPAQGLPADSSQTVRTAPKGTQAVYDANGNFLRFDKRRSTGSAPVFHNGPDNKALQLYKQKIVAPGPSGVMWTDANDPYYHHHRRHNSAARTAARPAGRKAGPVGRKVTASKASASRGSKKK